MNVSLSSATPSVTTTGLTEGAAYAFQHVGGIAMAVQVGASGTWQAIYAEAVSGGGFIPALIGTALRWTLDTADSAAEITLTAAT